MLVQDWTVNLRNEVFKRSALFVTRRNSVEGSVSFFIAVNEGRSCDINELEGQLILTIADRMALQTVLLCSR